MDYKLIKIEKNANFGYDEPTTAILVLVNRLSVFRDSLGNK